MCPNSLLKYSLAIKRKDELKMNEVIIMTQLQTNPKFQDSRFVKYGVELGRDKHADIVRKSNVIPVYAIKAFRGI